MATTDHKIRLSAQDKTKSALSSVRRSMGNLKGAIFNVQNAVAALAGGAGFGLLVKNALATVDSLAKASSKLGITTEALAGFRLAAELSGVASNTADMALQRFTRRLSEAANDTGEAKDALRELNLDAQALQKIPLDQQMLIVADAFQKVESQSDRVRLAFKLFDSEGVGLINTLEGGSAALIRTQEEAQRLGLAIDGTRARAVERFNDSILMLRSSVQGAFIQAMGEAAPQLTKISQQIQGVLVPAVKGLISGFSWFLDNLEAITKLVRFFVIAFAVNKIIDFTNSMVGVIRNMIVIGKVSKISGRALLRSFGGPILAVGIAIADVTGGLDLLLKKFGMMDTALPGVTEAIDNAKQSTGDLHDEFILTVTAGNQAADSFANVSDSVKEASKSMKQFNQSALRTVEDGLVDVATGTTSAADGFRSMASSIIRDLIRMQIQQSIMGPLSNALGTLTGVTYGTNPGSQQSRMLAAQDVGFRAMGGPVTRNKPYVVGERGPELFVPNGSGNVVSNDDMTDGGTTINQTIQISTGVQQTVRTEIASLSMHAVVADHLPKRLERKDGRVVSFSITGTHRHRTDSIVGAECCWRIHFAVQPKAASLSASWSALGGGCHASAIATC